MSKKAPKKAIREYTAVYNLERVITGKFFYEFPKKEEAENPELNYSIEPVISTKVEEERVFIKLKVNANSATSNHTLITMETLVIFKLKDLKNYLILEKGIHIFESDHKPLLINFLSISISTARGILIEKLKGTIFDSKLMPVIDPNSFFQKKAE